MLKTIFAILLALVTFTPGAVAGTITWTADANVVTRTDLGTPANEVTEVDGRVLTGSLYGYLHFNTGTTYSGTDQIQSAKLRVYLPYDSKNTQSALYCRVCG